MRRTSVVADGAGRGLGVELIRVVEHGRLGGACGRAVVVAGDGVEELGEYGRVEVARALLDHPQPEVDVPEEPAFVALPERRPRTELADPADVVEECRGEHEVLSETRMELCGLATQGCYADRVLEEATRVAVVAVPTGRRERAKRFADVRVPNERVDDGGEPLVGDLGCEELEEAVELVGIAPQGRRERGRVGVLGGLDRPHLHLELPAEALDAAEHPHGVALDEALVEQVDVVPDPGVDAATGVDELECEVRGARPGAPALLPRDCEHAFDGPVFYELGDRGHVPTI